jgi:hypothetical protein
MKQGVPTGTGYCRVYKVSDNSLLGTIGSIDVSTINNSVKTTYTFNSTPYNVASSTDIYICFEYTGGTSANNIRFYSNSGSPTGGKDYYYTGTWTSNTGYDAYYTVTYTPAANNIISAPATAAIAATGSIPTIVLTGNRIVQPASAAISAVGNLPVVVTTSANNYILYGYSFDTYNSNNDLAKLNWLVFEYYRPGNTNGTDFSLTTLNWGGDHTATGQAAFVTACHNAGKKALVSVNNSWGITANNIVFTNTTYRDALFSSIQTIITTYGFDGIEFDWESDNQGGTSPTFTAANQHSYYAAARTYFGSSIIIIVTENFGSVVQEAGVLAHIDYLSIMEYDAPTTWYTTLAQVQSDMGAYASAGFNKAQLICGTSIAVYSGGSWSQHYDWLVNSSGHTVLTSENSWSTYTWNGVDLVASKIAWLKANNYGGMFFYDLQHDIISSDAKSQLGNAYNEWFTGATLVLPGNGSITNTPTTSVVVATNKITTAPATAAITNTPTTSTTVKTSNIVTSPAAVSIVNTPTMSVVAKTSNILLQPAAVSITNTPYLSVVAATASQFIQPANASIAATGYLSIMLLSSNILMLPGKADIATTGMLSIITNTSNQLTQPAVAAIILTPYLSIMTTTASVLLQPANAIIVNTPYLSVIAATGNMLVMPGKVDITTTGYLSVVSTTAGIIMLPAAASIIATFNTNFDTGALSPNTMADDNTVGTVAWNNVDNAMTSDNSYATAVLVGQNSHRLKATNFGFNIPSGAEIVGIKTELEGKTLLGNRSFIIQLLKNGAYTGLATNGQFTTTEQYSVNGGNSSLWNTTWTSDDVNASNFGLGFWIYLTTTDTVSVDHIRITVYYNISSPGLSTVSVTQNALTQPGKVDVVMTGQISSVPVTYNQLIQPANAGIVVTTYTSVIVTTANQLVQPPAGSIILTGQVSTILIALIVKPNAASIAVVGYLSAVLANAVSMPGTASITAIGYISVIILSANKFIQPNTASIITTGFISTLLLSDNKLVSPTVASIVAVGQLPTNPVSYTSRPDTASIVITGQVPLMLEGTNITVSPDSAIIVVTGMVVDVARTISAEFYVRQNGVWVQTDIRVFGW